MRNIRFFAWLVPHLVLLAVWVAACLTPLSAFAEDSVTLMAETIRQPLVGKLQRYYDDSNQLSISEVVQLARDGKFETIERNDGLGYVPGTVWLHFRVDRAPEVSPTWWLEVRRPSLDEVDLYQMDSLGTWRNIELGDNRPWAGREIRNRNSVFILDVEPGGKDYFVRIKTTSSTAARLTLWQPSAFAHYAAQDMVLISGFVLSIAVVMLINLLMAVIFRERLYLIYSVNLFAFGGMLALGEGWVHFVIAPAEAIRAENLIAVFHPLFLLMMGLLFRGIVALGKCAPRLDRIYLAAVVGVGALGLAAVPLGISDTFKPWLWKFFLFEVLVNVVIALWLALQRNRQAIFYLAAFGVLLLGGVRSIMTMLGWLPDHVLGHVWAIVGSLVHMVLMQMTVSDRVQSAKRAYDEARELALQAERRASDGLNREVARRTQALESALASEHRVAEQQRMFIRLISHEFRTPLAVIDASARSISLLPTLPGDVTSRCGNIRNAVLRLSTLLEKCVADSRLESDQTLERQSVSIEDLVAGLEGQIRLEFPGRKVLFHSPVSQCVLSGDPVLLQILFGNLLSNALKYSTDDSIVDIDFFMEAETLRAIVTDRGSGIPAEELPHVFDKFMRGSHAASCAGLGLGLPLARRIVELHEGSIEIESQPEKGTRVIVRLPMHCPTE